MNTRKGIFKLRKFNVFLIISLAFIIISGNFLPAVLAYEKNDINLSRSRSDRKALFSDEINAINNDKLLSSQKENDLRDLPVSIGEKKNNLNSLKQVQKEKINKKEYVEGEVLVKYKESKINLETSSGQEAARNVANSKSLEKKEDLRKNNVSVLKIKDNKTVEQKVAELKSDPNVEYAQPNFQYYPREISSNDTHKNNLWGLDNTGQTINGSSGNITGTNDADIDAPEAWEINEGENDAAIVAVIDDGVAYNHPDLQANMWDGTNCVDENGGSLGGCNHGYDYENNDKTPLPIESHGTHIAGTIAAVKNNNEGITGVAPNTKIMAIRSSLTTANSIQAIDFAEKNGAKVINASWGTYGESSGSFYDVALYNAIDRFSGLFMVAAGNANYNHDDGVTAHKSYPDGFKIDTSIGPGLENIIVVAATDQNDDRASFSDYGVNSVDVGAPGTNIYSTVIVEEEATFSSVLDETFEGVAEYNVPNGWIQTGDWGVFNLGENLNVLYGDVNNYPYKQTANSTITSTTYNLNTDFAVIDFVTMCDTEYNSENWADYMVLEFSGDNGNNFTEAYRWNEIWLDYLNSDPYDSTDSAFYHFELFNIPNQYLTNNFKFRFRWVANGNADTGSYGDGCLIDDINIIKKNIISDKDGSDGIYDYKQGTSMAAPHVAGLAGLIWGFKPELTSSEVKNTILNTGDSISSLSEITTTGKRINAFNALDSLLADMDAYNSALAAVNEVDYSSASWTAYQVVVNENIKTNQDSQTDVDTATANIVAAQANLVSDLTAYNNALNNVIQADYTDSTWATYQAVVDANVVTDQDIQGDVDTATAAIEAAQADLIEVANMDAYNSALAAVNQVDYTDSTWATYQAIVDANVVDNQDSQAAVDEATNNITNAQNDLVEVANMDSYNSALAAVNEADYSTASWATYQSIVSTNVVTNQNSQSEVDTATANIVAAQADLVSDLTAYNNALANVTQADYTDSTWATYQGVVNANIVTDQNIQSEVDAATENITNAQADLIEVANMDAYNAALAAVIETDYTDSTWATYQAIVDANVVDNQDSQAAVDEATNNITNAQNDLVEVANMDSYNSALAAVNEADYSTASWATYQSIVSTNVVTNQNSQSEVDTATANIVAAQANLVSDLTAYNNALNNVIQADYTDSTWATYQAVVDANVVTDQDIQGDVDTATAAIEAAQADLIEVANMDAYNSALAAVNQVDYTDSTWATYQAIVDANVVDNQDSQAAVDEATNNITNAQNDLVEVANMDSYNSALAAVNEADYSTASWATYQSIVSTNVVTNQNSQSEVDTATANIVAAQADLVSDLTAYEAALANVIEEDYTAESWATYQIVVNANIVTDQDIQGDVDTATANIIAAQDNLVSDLAEYNAALAAVIETDYTDSTWATYQAIVDANVVDNLDTQEDIDTATANIIAAQADLVEVANMDAYYAALAAVNEADYTDSTWATYQGIINDNFVTNQYLQSEVDTATANIIAAQADLITVANMDAYNSALAAVNEVDYSIASWADYQAIVNANVVTSQNSQSEVDTATANIIAAQADLVSDLVDYNAALAAVNEEDYTDFTWAAYQIVVNANIVNSLDTQEDIDTATANIIAAQADLVEVANMDAYNSALAAVNEADYTDSTWATYQAIVDANVKTNQDLQVDVDAATAAIESAQNDLITVANMDSYNSALAAVNEADYSTASWATYQSIVSANVVTNQNSQSEVDTATANIVAAQADLVSDLTAYEAALAAVNQADYTDSTWAAYQIVVNANIVTDQNIQSEVDTATANIIAAQADLVEVANMDAYNSALAAVNEADYTDSTWATYQAIVDANVKTNQDLQVDVDAATAAIIAAQADLVEISDLTNYDDALAAVNEVDYSVASWTTYQGIVNSNIVTNQDSQTEVNTATANIIAAQADLVSDLAEYNAALAAVNQADYTDSTWVAYQIIVNANVVTDQDLQGDVDAATANITAAQDDLITVANMDAYNAALVNVTEEDYTDSTWVTYQGVVNANIVTNQNIQSEVDAATENITNAQADLIEVANMDAYNAALAAVIETDYTDSTWATYQAIVDANVVDNQDSQAAVDEATNNITNAQNDLVEVANMDAYNAALANVTQSDYTDSTWTTYQTIVDANVVDNQDSQAAVDEATNNITNAQNDLVEVANMDAYNSALAAVSEVDYSTASWETYQGVVSANVVTNQDSQGDVDTATAAIEAAQADLVSDLTAYNNAIAAVDEENYTPESWATYQSIVDANVVTDQNIQSEVSDAVSNILAAQDDLVLKLAAYEEALAAVNEEDYSTTSWATYQVIVDANVVDNQNSQEEVDEATANIIAAQANLVLLGMAPTAEPSGGEFAYSLLVIVDTPSDATKTYYTEDGSDPDDTNGNLVNGPISIALSDENTEVILKAISYDDDGNEGLVMTETYTYNADASSNAGEQMLGAFVDGVITIEGDDYTDTTKIIFEEDFMLEDGDNRVLFKAGTEMTRNDVGSMNILAMELDNITNALGSGVIEAIQLGIPGMHLTFDPAIIITIHVGSAYNGQTLDIYYQAEGESDWVKEITCIVADGDCVFETTHATKYSVGDEPGVDYKSEEKDDTEDLEIEDVEYKSTKNTITIKWETNNKANSEVKYGTADGHLDQKEKDGDEEKDHKITLEDLNPGTIYYFRVYSVDENGSEDKTKTYSIRTEERIIKVTEAIIEEEIPINNSVEEASEKEDIIEEDVAEEYVTTEENDDTERNGNREIAGAAFTFGDIFKSPYLWIILLIIGGGYIYFSRKKK